MFETMHYDIHLEKERGMLKVAETSRQIRLLRSRRRKMRSRKPLFDILWFGVREKMRQVIPTHAATKASFLTPFESDRTILQ